MNRHISTLNRFIAQHGETVELQRTTGAMPNQSTFKAPLRAGVRKFKDTELVGTIKDGDFKVILSPTPLDAVQWQGGVKTTDKIVFSDHPLPLGAVQGKVCSIASAMPLYINGVLVRWDLHVQG